jgi:Protein of unknown function (DUF3072)
MHDRFRPNKSADSRRHDLLVMAQENEQPEGTPPDSPTPPPPTPSPAKPPEEWATGKEPMTGPQRSYLQTLCREAGEEFNENLTKAEASKKIDELQAKTGRGKKN